MTQQLASKLLTIRSPCVITNSTTVPVLVSLCSPFSSASLPTGPIGMKFGQVIFTHFRKLTPDRMRREVPCTTRTGATRKEDMFQYLPTIPNGLCRMVRSPISTRRLCAKGTQSLFLVYLSLLTYYPAHFLLQCER